MSNTCFVALARTSDTIGKWLQLTSQAEVDFPYIEKAPTKHREKDHQEENEQRM